MSNESVNGVEQPGWSTVTPRLDSVPSLVVRVLNTQRVEQVYDLHVDEDHEFFANGVLVHNSLRYLTHNRHVVDRALAKAGSQQRSLPAAAGDEERRPAEREDELERGVRGVRVIRNVAPGKRPGPGRELVASVGAEDSPLRARSSSIRRPTLDLRSERID